MIIPRNHLKLLILSICRAIWRCLRFVKRNDKARDRSDSYFISRLSEMLISFQAKKQLNNLSIYEKNQPKGKSFKALLSEDQDDIEFYNSIKKKHADKALITRQTRGEIASSSVSNNNQQIQLIDIQERKIFMISYLKKEKCFQFIMRSE